MPRYHFDSPCFVGNDQRPTLTSAALSRLTPRVLGYILDLVSGDIEICSTNRQEYLDSLRRRGATALQLSQVNKQWRAAALATKNIWRGLVLSWSLHFSSLEGIKTVLRRSSPLTLDIEIPRELKPEIFPDVMQEIRIQDRTRTLHVDLSPMSKSSTDSPTPKEYRLVANLPSRPLNPSQSINQVPSLRKNAGTRPQSFTTISKIAFPSMKCLKCLDDASQKRFAPIPIIMDCIRDSQTLEVLRITGQPEYESSESLYLPEVPTLQKICKLSSLKELSIKAPISTCAMLIKNIDFPLACSLSLVCYNAAFGICLDEVIWRTMQYLNPWRCESGSESSGRQTLHVSATHLGFSLEGSKSLFPGTFQTTETFIHPNMTLVLDWSQLPSQSRPQTLTDLLPVMLNLFRPRSNWPTVFCVDADNGTSIKRIARKPIVDWLIDTPLFQTLEFRTFDAFVLIEPLFRVRNHPRAIANQIVPFLCELTFYDISYTSNIHKLWRRFARGLRRRQRAKNAIGLVEFVDCVAQARLRGMENMLWELIDMLTPLVDEILVDGKDHNDGMDLADDDMGYDTDSTVSDIDY